MYQTYAEFMAILNIEEPTWRYNTLQLTFVLYLLAGQVALLTVWSVLRRIGPIQRTARIAFPVYLLLGQVALFLGWPRLVEAWINTTPVELADLVVIVHFSFVVCVLLLQVFILVGWPFGWKWTRQFWLRLAQVLAIELVAGQAIVGLECPLTTFERDLRGGGLIYNQGETPLARFCNRALFVDNRTLPRWTFPTIYGSFAGLVLLTWFLVPPIDPGSRWELQQATEAPASR